MSTRVLDVEGIPETLAEYGSAGSTTQTDLERGDRFLNKQELVASVAEKAGLTKKDAEKALNAIVDSIKEALNKGDKVSLVGFGTFEVRDRAARSGRNPQTGAAIKIPAGKVPAFRPGKELKESV